VPVQAFNGSMHAKIAQEFEKTAFGKYPGDGRNSVGEQSDIR